MASAPPPSPASRRWRAACPQCGAPVEFASAASPIAVCGYCRSTLARDGESLRRIGRSAELFEDHSPLQLGTTGRWQGAAFTLVGRLQLRYAEGSWNEWHALFDSGTSGWLSEDNGRYVMAFDAPRPAQVPLRDALRLEASVPLDGVPWQVASITRAHVAAAQGELPAAPDAQAEFLVVDLRNAQGEVGTLDYTEPAAPRWSIGRSAALADLALSGLREGPSEKTLGARSATCPSCGAAVQIQLASTRSVVCQQCQAVIDVSQGVGGDLAHHVQEQGAHERSLPRIPLGASAPLALGGALQTWQVVGYVERCETPDDPEDERVYWREYLLYAQAVGFAFLVDAEDGWSWSVPVTGAPQVRGEIARWQDTDYRKLYDYTSEITYVLGEFYWQLRRGERTAHTDYAAGDKRLNRERTGQELTWSAGQAIAAAQLAAAFKLPGLAGDAVRPDGAPLASAAAGRGTPLATFFVLLLVLLLVVALVRACSDDECDRLRQTFGAQSAEYQQCKRSAASGSRTSGGSWGGYGSGGGHK